MTTPRCSGACWGCGAAHAHAWFSNPTGQFHHVPTALQRRQWEAFIRWVWACAACPQSAHPYRATLHRRRNHTRLRIVGAYARHPSLGATDSTPWSAEMMSHLCFTYRQRGNMRVAHMLSHDVAPSEAAAAYHLLRKAPATALCAVFNWTQV